MSIYMKTITANFIQIRFETMEPKLLWRRKPQQPQDQ